MILLRLKLDNAMRDMVVDLLKMIEEHYENEIVNRVAKLMLGGKLISDEECRKATAPGGEGGW